MNKPVLLVVDDDAFSREYLRDALTCSGVSNLSVADNGRTALQIMGKMLIKPDYVICDVFMPEMDGFEFLEQLGLQKFRGKVILLSGGNESMRGLASDVALHYGISLTGSFSKPVTHQVLAQSMGLPLTA